MKPKGNGYKNHNRNYNSGGYCGTCGTVPCRCGRFSEPIVSYFNPPTVEVTCNCDTAKEKEPDTIIIIFE